MAMRDDGLSHLTLKEVGREYLRRMTRDDLLERERELAQQLASALETIQELRRQPDDLFAALARTETAEEERDEAHEEIAVLVRTLRQRDEQVRVLRKAITEHRRGWSDGDNERYSNTKLWKVLAATEPKP